MPKTLQQLTNEIKHESRVKGTDQQDDFIHDTINEVLVQHTEKQRFDEMYVPDYSLALSDGVGTYTLPANFQHLREVRFAQDNTAFRQIDVRNVYDQKARNVGFPRFLEKTGSSIRLFPYDGIRSTMGVQIDYYKTPDPLASSGDLFPIEKLINPVKREVISRVHLYYKEYKSAQAFESLSGKAEMEIQSTSETGG